MSILVILALAWCCSGQLVLPFSSLVPYNTVPEDPLFSRYQAADTFGQTSFGYQDINQARHEVRLADGRVIGMFSYLDTDGKTATTFFEAGHNGYRVLASNILPEVSMTDLAPAENELVAPEPIKYTAEVAKALADFLKNYKETAAVVATAPDVSEVEAHTAYLTPLANKLVAPEPVEYTAEVAKARAEFLKIYQKVAAAAAAAPDVPEVEAHTAYLAPPVNELVAPKPIEFTAEVAEARANFFQIYQKIAAASAAAPNVLEVEAPTPVEYTAEVAKARAEFFKTYQKIAAAAAAAPDVPEIEIPLPFATVTIETTAEGEHAAVESEVQLSPSATLTVEKTDNKESAFDLPETEESSSLVFSAEDSPTQEQTVAEEPATEIYLADDEIRRKKRQVFYNFDIPHFVGYSSNNEHKGVDDKDKLESINEHVYYTFPVDAATPVDTTKVEFNTLEHVLKLPAIKYVQPVVNIKPLKFTPVSPTYVPYHAPSLYYPFLFPGLQYPTNPNLSPKKE